MLNIVFSRHHREIDWHTVILFTLGFWLSGSFILDFVLIPSLSLTGMMNSDEFAYVGFVLFGIFNRVEMICASLILTATLVEGTQHYFTARKQNLAVIFAIILLLISLAYTYVFTPNLTAWGLCLDQFSTSKPLSVNMILWHGGYWLVEGLKYTLAVTLLRWNYCHDCRR